MILQTTDKEFLASIGVMPYDPESFKEAEGERVRTIVLRCVAGLQLAGIVAALVWTSI